MKNTVLLSLLLLGLGGSAATAANWPGWRGPDGSGVSKEQDLPLKWDTKENVHWRVDLPDAGNSSPIVWGNKVFVTQAIEKDNRRTLMCFDRASGKLLWQSGTTYTEKEQTQESNPYCAGTPATDGEHVFANFGSAGVYAYDMQGKELWHRDLGKLAHMFGNAISPVLYGDALIMNLGPDQKTRLIALNKKTGETVWEAEPPKIDDSERQQGGAGGRNFGPGMFVAPQILSQGDKDGDKKLSKEEFSNLADAWYDKLDPDKTGKVNQEQLIEKFNDILPPPQGMNGGGPGGGGGGQRDGNRTGGPGGPGGGGARGFGAGRFLGPGMFASADTDKDGNLTRAELKSTFEKWFASWDKSKSGSLDEVALREGLNDVLPRPQLGGQGGPGGGGRGPGGPGGGPGGAGGGGGPNGSWSTPILIKAAGHDELIVNFQNRLAAYDPKTGKQLWMSKGLGGAIYSSPMWGEGTVVAMSSGMGGGNAVAIKPGGTGDVTESQRVWKLDRVKSGIGTGVIYEGHIYTISQDGVAECFDLKTGERVWEERLKGSGSRSGSWSSVLLGGDKLYIPNQAGDVFVLRASPKFELLATNSVGESTNASLAAADGELVMRTDKSLWCIAKAK